MSWVIKFCLLIVENKKLYHIISFLFLFFICMCVHAVKQTIHKIHKIETWISMAIIALYAPHLLWSFYWKIPFDTAFFTPFFLLLKVADRKLSSDMLFCQFWATWRPKEQSSSMSHHRILCISKKTTFCLSIFSDDKKLFFFVSILPKWIFGVEKEVHLL